jgi:glutathione S-transferase
MKLYYSKGACSLAVRIALHEMNIPCEFEAVNLKTKQTESGEDYLKINPKGAVPTLLDGKEVITENAVIQQYLADKQKATNLLPPIGDIKRYKILGWLNYVSTDLHKDCGLFFNPHMPEDVKENIFRPLLKNKLLAVDQHLQKNTFLADEQFTLPDSYLFVILTWLPYIKLDITQWPNLQRYFIELKQRKSVQQALQEEGISA